MVGGLTRGTREDDHIVEVYKAKLAFDRRHYNVQNMLKGVRGPL